jgi:hypothetical protein
LEASPNGFTIQGTGTIDIDPTQQQKVLSPNGTANET